MGIEISSYLQGRKHNSQLLEKLGEEVFGPALEKFNEDNERQVKAEWNMSAKYQSITMSFEMEDGENLSPEFINFLVFGKLADLLSEWFAAEADEYDCENRSYVSVDIGL